MCEALLDIYIHTGYSLIFDNVGELCVNMWLQNLIQVFRCDQVTLMSRTECSERTAAAIMIKYTLCTADTCSI